ncbi:DnaJ-domain-containing protein [Cubamyces sp. BRFM 1775]|nr:DnaJ-domain-containing protein [Cubamyces sp. BRFM 1775]
MSLITVLQYAAWFYLPNHATRWLLGYLHVVYERLTGRPRPAAGTPQYVFHYRMTYLFCATVYLLFGLYKAATTVEPNYYELLGLAPTADEGMVKAAFRQFARKYHPDRVGPQGEAFFIEIRDAYESLKSPTKRFAYERFGPDALKWKQCTTLRDCLHHGLLQATGFYLVSLSSLIFFSFLNSSPVSFWRYIMLAFTAIYELLFILKSTPGPASTTTISSVLFTDPATGVHTSFLTFFWPQRVAYQHILFLHNLWVLGCFALSNIVPIVFPAPPPELQEMLVLKEATQIATLSQMLSRETQALLNTLYHSVHGPRTGTSPSTGTFPYLGPLPSGTGGAPPDAIVRLLAPELEHLILEAQMRDNGPLQSACEHAVERRRRKEDAAGRAGRSMARANGLAAHATWQNGGAVQGVPARRIGYVRGRSRSLG